MKRILLLTLLSCFISIFSVQGKKKFLIKEKQTVSAVDSLKNYAVLEFDGKTQKDLFDEILNQIMSIQYCNNLTIDKKEPDYLVLTEQIKNFDGTEYLLDITYSLQFKDKRIRINEPIYKLRDNVGNDCTSVIDYSKRFFMTVPRTRKITAEVIEDAINNGIDKITNIDW